MKIHWHRMTSLSHEKHSEIEMRLLQLAAEHRDLIDIRIAGKQNGQPRRGIQRVRLAGPARGTAIVAVRDSDSLHVATNEVLDAFERELRKLRSRRMRREERSVAREFRHRLPQPVSVAAYSA